MTDRRVTEEEIKQVLDENRILRGLIHNNPDWKCLHGYLKADGSPIPSIGHCPLGFPGCACADDLIAVDIEDGKRMAAEIRRLRAALDAQERELNDEGATIERIRAENEALRKDKARMDWLDSREPPLDDIATGEELKWCIYSYDGGGWESDDLREAIDAAMAQGER